jgi:hypothetical protein
MKVTKRQLRRIIKEEKQKLVNEYALGSDDAIDEAQELIYYALRSAEDDIENRGIKLGPGEFAKAVERAVGRFR